MCPISIKQGCVCHSLHIHWVSRQPPVTTYRSCLWSRNAPFCQSLTESVTDCLTAVKPCPSLCERPVRHGNRSQDGRRPPPSATTDAHTRLLATYLDLPTALSPKQMTFTLEAVWPGTSSYEGNVPSAILASTNMRALHPGTGTRTRRGFPA